MQGLRLGTRASPLALAQARKVAAAIETSQRWPDGWVQIIEITTTGDKVIVLAGQPLLDDLEMEEAEEAAVEAEA